MNGSIPIQTGTTRVEQGVEQEVLADESLRFEWTPHAGLVGSFTSRRIRLGAVTLRSDSVGFDAEFQVFESGAGGRFWATDDVAIVHQRARPLEMTTVDIHVPNLPQVLGSAVGNERVVLYGRQEFSFNGWRLVMDPILTAREQVKSAKAAVGSVLTHVIRARRECEHPFELTDLSTLLDELYLVLSFAFGDYLGPMLAVGRNAEAKIVLEFLRPTIGFGWRSRFGVAPTRTGIGDMLSCLGRLFEPQQKVLAETIWWYLEACWSLAEASVVLAQAALERIAYHHLVLTTGMLTESQFDKRTAASQIRETMQSLSIPSDFLGGDGDVASIVTRCRNQQVHPKVKGQVIPLHEAREGALRLVELLILRLSGYQGMHHPRGSRLAGAEEPVPWAEKLTRP